MDANIGTTAKLQKLAPVRIFEQAVEQIRDLISSGALARGEKLPAEQELSRQLGVSRSTVREALRVLESEGCIEIRRGSGAYISAPVPAGLRRRELLNWLGQREETLEQVLAVRESIESLAASLAAQFASAGALAEIRSIVKEQVMLADCSDETTEADVDTLARLDAMFHLAVSSASGNDIAHEIVSHLIPAFNESNKAVLYLGRRAKKMESEHQEILAALEARNPEAAARSMQMHIKRVEKEILAIQPERPST